MAPFIVLFLLLVVAGVFGYLTYSRYAQRRTREKKRNQYHDRV